MLTMAASPWFSGVMFMVLLMRAIPLILLLFSAHGFAEVNFYSVSNVFRTSYFVIDYKDNINYEQYIPKNYSEILKGPIPPEYFEEFERNEF